MSTDFLQKVEKSINRYSMLRKNESPVVVAFSGGADSVALLAALTKLGYRCIAAHCNFQLRGNESQRDRDFAFSMSQRLGVEFREIKFNVEQRRTETGESVEMACRELRYEWFSMLKKELNAQAVATGHHCGDNIETMFLNLLRGTGLRGAAGISPVADRRVSPLIECTRQEILEFINELNLNYIVDSTNLENNYQRNKIRNIVLPAISREFLQAETMLGISLGHLSEDRELMEYLVAEKAKQYFSLPGTVCIDELKANEPLAAPLLYKFLRPFGFSRLQSDALLSATSGSRFESAEWIGILSRGIFVISRKQDSSKNISYKMNVLEKNFFEPTANANIAWFSPEILLGNPEWELRAWQQADRMKPFGMNGRTKKLSDIFNDMKVPEQFKHEPRVLLRNGEIVWVLGVKNSNLFRVRESDTQVVKFSVENV